MLNLRSVDLNLLPVFEAIYEERSLSRAADRLAMTQSAVSHALSRLRSVFREDLFIRQPRGVVPTRVADRLYATLRGALASVRESVAETRSFDPATSDRKFFVAVSHPLGPMIAVRLRERLGRIAPGVEVAFSTRSRPMEIEQALRDGRIDAAVDWLVPERGPFHEVTLFEDAVVVVARSGHPALRRNDRRANWPRRHSYRCVRASKASIPWRDCGSGNDSECKTSWKCRKSSRCSWWRANRTCSA